MKQWIVPLSALVYWGGVWLRALQLKRRIGKLPNLGPRGKKENILWACWLAIVLGWAFTPTLSSKLGDHAAFRPFFFSGRPFFDMAGLLAIAAGFAGTVWCHQALGDAWRIGVRAGERTTLVTNGPYRTMRHPIYFFQIMMLAGVFFLFPSPFTLALPVIHTILAFYKIADEEQHLHRLHGPLYKEYRARSGGLWPKF